MLSIDMKEEIRARGVDSAVISMCVVTAVTRADVTTWGDRIRRAEQAAWRCALGSEHAAEEELTGEEEE